LTLPPSGATAMALQVVPLLQGGGRGACDDSDSVRGTPGSPNPQVFVFERISSVRLDYERIILQLSFSLRVVSMPTSTTILKTIVQNVMEPRIPITRALLHANGSKHERSVYPPKPSRKRGRASGPITSKVDWESSDGGGKLVRSRVAHDEVVLTSITIA
jgi:hypothetical protein